MKIKILLTSELIDAYLLGEVDIKDIRRALSEEEFKIFLIELFETLYCEDCNLLDCENCPYRKILERENLEEILH